MSGFGGQDVIELLLVDDDDNFAAELGEYLTAHGFEVGRLASFAGLEDRLRREQPALLLLDQFLGRFDSLPLLPKLRAAFAGGIIVLTGNQADTDRILGLELGADDFVTKSQQPREILARLHAVLRRVNRQLVQLPEAVAAPQPWKLDSHRRELFAPNGHRVDLTSTEYELLAYFRVHEGQPLSRDELSAAVLNRAYTPIDRSVDNLVARIRLKLKPFVGDQMVIKSVRAAGYVFVGFNTTD